MNSQMYSAGIPSKARSGVANGGVQPGARERAGGRAAAPRRARLGALAARGRAEGRAPRLGGLRHAEAPGRRICGELPQEYFEKVCIMVQ